MDGSASQLLSFFSSIPKPRREVLILQCASQLDQTLEYFKDAEAADSWLRRYLDSTREKRGRHHFGKVVSLIAVLDFELSPYALSRLIAMYEHFIFQEANSPDKPLTEMARKTLRDTVPELKKIADAWQDVRRHELDEASLWVYRDEMQRQDREETRKLIDRLRSW